MKGRPPGTPKSNDPNKKKRKRTARERDLCDVKIKITEYLPGAVSENGQDPQASSFNATSFASVSSDGPLSGQQTWSLPSMAPADPLPPPSSGGAKYYTIQRVNGYVGDGKTDGAPELHRHTLDESDRVKKNSVVRWTLKREKENKRNNVSLISFIPEKQLDTQNCCDNVIIDCGDGKRCIMVGCFRKVVGLPMSFSNSCHLEIIHEAIFELRTKLPATHPPYHLCVIPLLHSLFVSWLHCSLIAKSPSETKNTSLSNSTPIIVLQ